MDAMKFHEKFAHECVKRGITQSRLAKMLGGDVAKSTLSNWWQGKAVPPVDVAYRIAKAIGVSLDYLADDGRDESEAESADPALSALLYNAGQIGYAEAVRRILNPAPMPSGQNGGKVRFAVPEPDDDESRRRGQA